MPSLLLLTNMPTELLRPWGCGLSPVWRSAKHEAFVPLHCGSTDLLNRRPRCLVLDDRGHSKREPGNLGPCSRGPSDLSPETMGMATAGLATVALAVLQPPSVERDRRICAGAHWGGI